MIKSVTAGFSHEERRIYGFLVLAAIPMTVKFGTEGFLAMLSVATWLLPSYADTADREPTGNALRDVSQQFIEGVWAFPLWTYFLMGGAWGRALVILPLAAALALCYYVTWYGPEAWRSMHRRYAMIGLSWAVALAVVL